MSDLTASEAALLGAGIAAAATLVGTLLGFLLQAWLARRQRKWAVADADAQRAHELTVREAERREHRFLTLRAERREAYGQFLDHAHEYMAAIRDLRDAGLPADVQVSSMVDVEKAHPVAARALHAMGTQQRLDSSIDLIADREVRATATALSDALRAALGAAVRGEDGLKDAYPLYHATVTMMRRELVGVDGRSEPKADPTGTGEQRGAAQPRS